MKREYGVIGKVRSAKREVLRESKEVKENEQ